MHQEAANWIIVVAAMLGKRKGVIDFGAKWVNGSVKPLFQTAETYIGIDLVPGEGVDLVADASTWKPDPTIPIDTVICTEVFEHTPLGREICKNACEILPPGGAFIVSAAGPDRLPHSAVDGLTLRQGEYYRGVSAADLREWLNCFGFCMVDDFSRKGDVYAMAVKTIGADN